MEIFITVNLCKINANLGEDLARVISQTQMIIIYFRMQSDLCDQECCIRLPDLTKILTNSKKNVPQVFEQMSKSQGWLHSGKCARLKGRTCEKQVLVSLAAVQREKHSQTDDFMEVQVPFLYKIQKYPTYLTRQRTMKETEIGYQMAKVVWDLIMQAMMY